MPPSIDARLTSLERTVGRLIEAIGFDGATGAASGAGRRRYALNDVQLTRLAQKLDAFGARLDDAERATLLSVLGAAAVKFEEAGGSDGSSPFAKGVEIFAQGQLKEVGLGEALAALGKVDHGTQAGMEGELEDSISVGADAICVHGDWSKDLAAEMEGSVTPGELGTWRTGQGSYTDIPGGLPGGYPFDGPPFDTPGERPGTRPGTKPGGKPGSSGFATGPQS
ncbi:hypothetical protein [Embleya sp. NPDC001921]